MKIIIVVGNGMTGYKYCEKLVARGLHKEFKVIVFGEEPRPAYDRVHLTNYYTGTPIRQLTMANKEWYSDNDITLKINERITDIDIKAKTVISNQGETLAYDKLVLATGSSAFVPPLDGVNKTGVFVYRTIEDLDAIKAYIPKAKNAAVIGGGLLGLEAANALMNDGLNTTVIEYNNRLMPRQVDDAGGNILKERLEALKLNVLLSKNTKQFLGNGHISGIEFTDGTHVDVDMVVISAGIKPRDEVAKKAGIKTGERGGIAVDNQMLTSDPDIYAIGECALWDGKIYGLVAPCYEMADVALHHLMGLEKSFNGFDMSTKLKLIGNDVASFGDPFAVTEGSQTIVYENKRKGIYKRINVSADGKLLLGGVLVGDAAEYNMLLQMVNNKMPLPEDPEELILGSRGSGGGSHNSAASLPDTAVICSCESVTKKAICDAIADSEEKTVASIKKCTKAGTGCGGCVPVLDELLTHTLKADGVSVKKLLCEHFQYTRQELLEIVKIENIKSYTDLLKLHGKGNGCETCRPAVASIFASTWNDLVTNHACIQDTNDKYLANIQKGGTYSVVPRIPGGEITPEKLVAMGKIAQKYDLYTKITGGQRIDMFGARVHELPMIWEELVNEGFESGHAYGKSIRTVKSCVGSTWCRFGLQDSVGFAIRIEERYKGLRSPHKLKGGVSGCIRECAEARSKDFGIIATEKGYNLYVCGNGGANPQHASLLASDIDEETVTKYIDRFLIYYIKTAEPLARTSKWFASVEGGIDHIKDVVINDSLGLNAEFEKEMQYLVDTYQCEWKSVVENPDLRKRFKHFHNSDEIDDNSKFTQKSITGQRMPAPWSKA